MVMPADMDGMSKEALDALETGKRAMREAIEAMLPENRLKKARAEIASIKTSFSSILAECREPVESITPSPDKAVAYIVALKARVEELEGVVDGERTLRRRNLAEMAAMVGALGNVGGCYLAESHGQTCPHIEPCRKALASAPKSATKIRAVVEAAQEEMAAREEMARMEDFPKLRWVDRVSERWTKARADLTAALRG